MVRLTLLFLLLGCATASGSRPAPSCPYLIDCQQKCHQTGFLGAAVVEDEENYQCFCTQPVKSADET